MTIRDSTRVLSMIGVVMVGCATGRNLQPVRHSVDPHSRVEPAPGFSADGFRTFSVFPLSWVSMATRLRHEQMEQQILFTVRNQFEALGYTFVRPEESPDFFVTVDAAIAARLPRPPDPTAPLPFTMPHPAFIHPVPLASIIEMSSTMLERVHWLDDTSHAYRTGDWARWSDPRPRHPDAPVPLYPVVKEPAVRGDQAGAAGSFLRGLLVREEPQPAKPGGPPPDGAGRCAIPQVWVIVVDGKTFEEIWAATASGAITTGATLPGAAQLPVWEAVRKFPAKKHYAADTVEEGFGFRFQILTNDGVNFYPTITAIASNSPARAAGLESWDMIVSLAGVPTANMPWSTFTSLLGRQPAGPVGVTVWRNAREASSFLSSPGTLLDPAFLPAQRYPVSDPPSLGLGW